jgi:hypothetical protein
MTSVTCARQFCLMADQVGGTLGQAPAGTIRELQRHASIWRPGSTKPVRLLAIDDEMHSTQHRGAQAPRIPPVTPSLRGMDRRQSVQWGSGAAS